MTKYKTTIRVTAEQWFPGKTIAGVTSIPNRALPGGPPFTAFRTDTGASVALSPGDWILTHPSGHRVVSRQADFAKNFEVDE